MTFDTSTHTAGLGLWGLLMFVALGVELVLASLAFVYVRRLLALRTLPAPMTSTAIRRRSASFARTSP